MNDLPLRSAADIGAVEDRFFTLRNFPLTDGTVMPETTIAYESYGRPAPDGRNAILCTHGYTGSHHFAGRNPANGNQPGSWDGLIGPGKAIDTDKLFVVASNMLGSSFGSTNAGSINPQTGEAYGPDFPNITIRDIVAAQKALLDHLGVRHLVAVAGPSYGGYQAFQWAVAYPDFMDAIAPVNTAPWASVIGRDLRREQRIGAAQDVEHLGLDPGEIRPGVEAEQGAAQDDQRVGVPFGGPVRGLVADRRLARRRGRGNAAPGRSRCRNASASRPGCRPTPSCTSPCRNSGRHAIRDRWQAVPATRPIACRYCSTAENPSVGRKASCHCSPAPPLKTLQKCQIQFKSTPR